MKKIHLDNGLQLSVREDVMDNMELLDALVELNEGNGYAISRVINMILEKDEKKNCMTTSAWTG